MENNKFIEFIDQKISEYKESLEETQNELSKSIRDRYPLQKIMIQEMYYKKWLEDIKNSENPKKMIETCLDMFERQRERFEEIKSSWKELEDFSKIEFPDENEDEDFIKILIDAKMLINTD
jgi:acyl carrier protein phosphodiesterase